MGKISDLGGAWLEDEAGHGIYDEAGMAENPTGALSSAGAVSATRFLGSRSNAGVGSFAGATSRATVLQRSLSGDI